MKWPKYCSFSFSISPSNEYSGLISFRIDWLDLLAVQGTLKSLLQHHSSKASILRCSAFFTVQLSHPYMTTRKTIALTRETFVGKVMSLFLNMLSRLVITFHYGIDWLDLLAVQGTLKSLFQHHSSKASVLQHSAFFIVQLSHQYLTTATQNVFQLVSNVGTPKAAFDVTLATMACMHAC